MKFLNVGSAGALLFLVISLGYGYFAFSIQLLPGEENEPFNSRTLPFALSILGAAFSLLELFFSLKKSTIQKKFVMPKKKELITFSSLIVAVCCYALSLTYIGFLIATVIFIFVCALILGERKPKTLFLSSVVFVVCFWALLKFGLDLYVDSGSLFK